MDLQNFKIDTVLLINLELSEMNHLANYNWLGPVQFVNSVTDWLTGLFVLLLIG
jgi:hypothetical protein